MLASRVSHVDMSLAWMQPSGAPRAAVALDGEAEFDDFESEVKRTIERCGMLSPQFDTAALESWD